MAGRSDPLSSLEAGIWDKSSPGAKTTKSPTREALKYFAKYWDGLILFIHDGRIELDNNPVERTVRPITLDRKNTLFAGHDAGAQNWAIIASLIEPCKLNGIEPHGYLSGVLTAIAAGHKQTYINDETTLSACEWRTAYRHQTSSVHRYGPNPGITIPASGFLSAAFKDMTEECARSHVQRVRSFLHQGRQLQKKNVHLRPGNLQSGVESSTPFSLVFEFP